MTGSVVYHNPGELQVSPALTGRWDRPPADLVVEAMAWGFGQNADDACAAFLGWLGEQSPAPGSFRAVHPLGEPWADPDHDPWDWYDRVMAEVAGWDPPPVLVDLENFQITHRGEVLWPPPEHRRELRVDRRSRPAGAPFPRGWFGQELDGFRPGRGTYECYPPEELPPVRVALTGSFDWLRSAPEWGRSVAPDVGRTAAALDRLLAANPAGLPQEFVTFFRSPTLWNRVRSCTDCYLDLDPAAVGVRGGSGSLVRFLSDSQGCKHWHLWLAPGGTTHAVVATYHYTGSESAHLPGGLPHPRDVTTCAGSFEEFVYRFWLENELWFALHDGGPMPEGGQDYLAFYRSSP